MPTQYPQGKQLAVEAVDVERHLRAKVHLDAPGHGSYLSFNGWTRGESNPGPRESQHSRITRLHRLLCEVHGAIL